MDEVPSTTTPCSSSSLIEVAIWGYVLHEHGLPAAPAHRAPVAFSGLSEAYTVLGLLKERGLSSAWLDCAALPLAKFQ